MSIRYSLDRVLVVVCAVLFTCTAIHAKDCGYKPIKLGIVNGTVAYENEFPWQVSLRFYNELTQNYTHFCGGSILGDNWVLTAAHCIDLLNNSSNIDVNKFRAVVGAHRMSQPSKNQQVIEIKRIHVHPMFDLDELANDIALVELSRPIGLNSTELSAICLGRPNDDVEGNLGVISGWGVTNIMEETNSDVLNHATVPVDDQDVCSALFKMVKPLSYSEICAGRETNICFGDDGGPLQYEINGRWYLLGVASWFFQCGVTDYPSVFTRVPYYLDFIKQVTGITPI